MQKKLQLSFLAALCAQLSAQDLELNTITVTSATKTEQKLSDVTANTEVITAEEIKEKRYTTVAEALNSLSGISFTNNGGLGKTTSVLVRGFDSKRVLVLIDGIRFNDLTGLSGAPFGHLMISDIERIEVVKSAQSGIWGADASAGVINIITKSAKTGLHTAANVELGSYNTQKYGAQLSYKTDDFYVKASSQLLRTNGFSTKVPAGADVSDFEDDGYRNITTNLKFGFAITPADKIDLSYTHIHAKSEYDPYDSNKTLEANKFGEDKTNDSFAQLNYKHMDSFNEFNLYAKSSKFKREYVTASSVSQYNGDVKEYGASSKIPYRKKDFTLIVADYKKFTHENSINKTYTNKAGALTNSNNIELSGEELIFVEALRYDHYDRFKNKTTGKLGFRYNSKALKSFSFSTNFGSAYNVPTLYQLYSNYGNTALTPEDTRSYDVTLEYAGFKATYFYNTVNDMIDYDSTISKYNNIQGKSVLKGYELGYKNFVGDMLLVDLSYTYLDAKNNAKQALKRRPQDTLKYALTYYPTQKLQFGINGEYIGSRFDQDDHQGAQTGYYTLVNFVTNYELSKNFTTYMKIDNMLDKKYQVVDGYATAARSYYIGLNYSY